MNCTRTMKRVFRFIACLWVPGVVLVPFQAHGANIHATAELSETGAYVQQNTVYTVRVYTDRTLKTADVSLPSVNGGMFTKLDDEWTARPVQGQQGTYVNERRYLFTPIRAGRLEIPPATVSVTTGGGTSQVPANQPWAQQYGQTWSQPSYGQQPAAQPRGQQSGQLPGQPPWGQPWGEQAGQPMPFSQPPAQQPSFGQPAMQPWGGQPAQPQSYLQQYSYPGSPGYGSQQSMPSPGGGERLELRTPPVSVEVTALVGDAASLLPMHSLRVEGNVQAMGDPRVGEPVTVGITVTGVGITGDRLPAITERLQSKDFKVYAERPRTEWAFDDRLQAVVGRRIETVTLVPTRTGALELPIVEIPYWNVISGRKEIARMATRPLRVQAATGVAPSEPESRSPAEGEDRVPLRTGSDDLWGFWLPVGGALLIAFLIGWRMGMAQRRQRQAREALEAGEAAPVPAPSPFAALGPAVSRTRGAAAGLMPGAMREKLSAGLGTVLRGINRIIPRRVKVWTCMRCVQRADEPHGICRILRRFATDCLGLPANSSLRSIGHAVARQRPSAESSAYVNLFGRLDDAAYGSTSTAFDIAAWKKDFGSLFGRLLRVPKPWARFSAGGGGLPELNPR